MSPGHMPPDASPPHFSTRCTHTTSQCHLESPILRDVSSVSPPRAHSKPCREVLPQRPSPRALVGAKIPPSEPLHTFTRGIRMLDFGALLCCAISNFTRTSTKSVAPIRTYFFGMDVTRVGCAVFGGRPGIRPQRDIRVLRCAAVPVRNQLCGANGTGRLEMELYYSVASPRIDCRK